MFRMFNFLTFFYKAYSGQILDKNFGHFVETYMCMLFTGCEVRIGKNCARGLEYSPMLQAEGRTQDQGYSFFQYGLTKAGKL